VTTGEHHERATQFYGDSERCASITRGIDQDLRSGRNSDNAIEASVELGRDQGRNEHTLAQGQQEHRWRPWVTVAYGFICAVIGFEVAQELPLAADGGIPDRERGGAAISRTAGGEIEADSRPRLNRSGGSGSGGGGESRSQRASDQDRTSVELHRHQAALLRYDGAGTGHRISERAWDIEGPGGADQSGAEQAQAARGESGKSRDGESKGSLYQRQRVSSVRPDEGRERRGAGQDCEKKRSVDQDYERNDQAGGQTLQSAEAESGGEITAYGGSGREVDSTDQVLDEDRPSSQGEDYSHGNYRSPCDCQRESEVRDEVVDQSFAGRLSLRPAGRAAGRRKQDAGRRLKAISRVIRSGGDTGDGDLRSRSESACRCQGTASRGSPEGRDPPPWSGRMDGWGGGSEGSQKRTWKDRRQHRQTQEQKIRILTSPGTKRENAGCSRAEGDCVGQFKHVAARFGRTGQVFGLGSRLNDESGNEKEKVVKKTDTGGV